MSVSDDVSYFSRFLVKFVEIIAVGFATAVSGYLIAHLSGALSFPTPAPAGAAVQVAPNPSTVSQSLPAQPMAPNSADGNEQRPAPPQQGTDAAPVAQPAPREVNAPAVAQPAPPQGEVDAPPLAQPARRSMNMAKSAPAHKHIETTTSVVESKRDQESFVSRIRAALGNADRTESLDVPPHQSDGSRGPAAIASQPKPVANPPAVAAAPSGAAELRPVPVQQAPIEPNPPTAMDIKSRPVTAIQSSSTPAPGKETGVISGLEEILRHDPLAGSDDAPRPPMPVGQ
ncbi:MAG: hypothetical protein WB689_13905 [Xanthobacteraceae bacterium]